MPSNEYFFFDIPEPKRLLGTRPEPESQAAEAGAGLPVTQPEPASEEEPEPPGKPQENLLFEPGPLATVRITPRHPRRKPGEQCALTATPRDQEGLRILEQVDYAWRISQGDGRLIRAQDNSCTVTRDQLGEVVVEVTATQGQNSATDGITAKFLENVPEDEKDRAKGLPSYRLEPEHGKPWRSRYDAKKNEIIINSAHRDFLSSRTTAAKHRRYIGKLYAKEVVLINFPHESPSEVMERLIELTLRTEDVL